MEGGHEKAEGNRIFSWEIGGSQKNQEIIGWLQILMKILFNEIAPKCIFSVLRALGVAHFFSIVAPGGGHKIFDHQIGGHKNITEVLSEIYDPPYSKENGGPLSSP